MPAGIHVRLVAPLEFRVRHLAELQSLDAKQAAHRVAEIDKNRAAFYRRHWPSESLAPERFTITINTAEVVDDAIVDCLMPIVRSRLAIPARH
jgi:hypothetical protein